MGWQGWGHLKTVSGFAESPARLLMRPSTYASNVSSQIRRLSSVSAQQTVAWVLPAKQMSAQIPESDWRTANLTGKAHATGFGYLKRVLMNKGRLKTMSGFAV